MSKVDFSTDNMVSKVFSIYEKSIDIYDLYYYLKNNPKYNLFQLSNAVEKKFGVAIEPVLLLAEINKLASNKKVKNFFQEEFNRLAAKKIR